MNKYAKNIAPAVATELTLAAQLDRTNPTDAFRHLERAHVLGQLSTRLHVQTHVAMLRWAMRHRQPKEIVGQLTRIIGASTKTAIGLVPTGNTGGANISPFRKLPVPDDLAGIIGKATK
jgi:Protein of unknown function (DUF3703)